MEGQRAEARIVKGVHARSGEGRGDGLQENSRIVADPKPRRRAATWDSRRRRVTSRGQLTAGCVGASGSGCAAIQRCANACHANTMNTTMSGARCSVARFTVD